jgi:hypothetical protein
VRGRFAGGGEDDIGDKESPKQSLCLGADSSLVSIVRRPIGDGKLEARRGAAFADDRDGTPGSAVAVLAIASFKRRSILSFRAAACLVSRALAFSNFGGSWTGGGGIKGNRR